MTITKKFNSKSVIAALLLVSSSAFAQSGGMQSARATNNDGYLIDDSGHVVKNSYGECWRTGSYNPGVSYNPECDGIVVAQNPTPASQPVREPYQEARGGYVVQEAWRETVYFNFDSAYITRSTAQVLAQVADHLRQDSNTTIRLHLTGHTDPVGTENYNLSLGSKRAVAVAQALRRLGVRNPIDTVSMGEAQVLNQCERGTDYINARERNECNAPNRRVEIVIGQ